MPKSAIEGSERVTAGARRSFGAGEGSWRPATSHPCGYRHEEPEGDGEPGQMLLHLSRDGLDGQAEHAEERGESCGHRGRGGQCPADGDRTAGGVVAEDEQGEVGGEQREAARVDGGEHARAESEGERKVGHGGFSR